MGAAEEVAAASMTKAVPGERARIGFAPPLRGDAPIELAAGRDEHWQPWVGLAGQSVGLLAAAQGTDRRYIQCATTGKFRVQDCAAASRKYIWISGTVSP
jgi:hypothetical protein